MSRSPVAVPQQRIQLGPSYLLAMAVLVAHGVATVSIVVLAVPAWVKVAVIAALLFNCAYELARVALLRASSSCVALRLDDSGVGMELRDGRSMVVKLGADCLVTPWLIVLALISEDERTTRRLLILPDSLNAESFRALRVWLKWGWAG
ncbi:protein YgfX [Ferriphaselus sp. R-1]|uniref:protein YgfX n=1 Tax=Ferriphaselus sp. R-1 TaxID=1485544 RepID=UPI00054FE5C6